MYRLKRGEGNGDSEPALELLLEVELLLLPSSRPPKLLIIEDPDSCRRLLFLLKYQKNRSKTHEGDGAARLYTTQLSGAAGVGGDAARHVTALRRVKLRDKETCCAITHICHVEQIS